MSTPDHRPSADPNPSFGLVLGAGGSVGWAYHLGVLEGIRAALDREPADADQIIGTSAGGAVAATLMAGATTDEVLESIIAPISPEQRERMAAIFRRNRRRPWRYLRPQAPGLLRRGGIVGLGGLLPAGAFPTAPLRRFPIEGFGAWPERLWLPAVRIDDGEVVVFGRDRTDVDVADAVEATSAVPALFQPKLLDGQRYIDGAVNSASHADLLAPLGLDLVLVSSAMTRPGRGLVRRRARRQLRREIEALEQAGSTVIMVEPDETIMTLADGYPRHTPEAGPRIVEAARRQTIEAIEAAELPVRPAVTPAPVTDGSTVPNQAAARSAR
ncbi:MAG: patatin-like phospholipase family protein [Actinomycetota bacterium]